VWRLFAFVAEPEQVQQLTRAPTSFPAPDPVVAGVIDEDLADVQEPVEVDLLLSQAYKPACLAGLMVMAEKVVLPAPLGPSSPKKAPSGRSRSRPLMAVNPLL
jgi:hypothetical protein